MRPRTSKSELLAWAVFALAGGCLVGWIDLSVTAVQATALVLMVVAFALTLPGRAPAPLIAICSAVGIPIVHAAVRHEINPGYVVVLVPAFIAAYGGSMAGKLLETATSTLVESDAATIAPWYARPLSTRFILAVALVVIAVAGAPVVRATLASLSHRAPLWTAFVWQIMTLLGWIGATPLILRMRASREHAVPFVRVVDVIRHLVIVLILAPIHVALLLVFSAALFIPVTPSWRELGAAALGGYVVMDLLAYLSILALANASNAERRRRAALQRETELRASALDNRLSVLRARLNPHFLFNALNSVHVLARSGLSEETVRVVEGLTELLRYVLDERRAEVPLAEEMAFVQRYLAVQQVRYGPRLQYEISYDETMNGMMVPQLLLQPIVENAVEHGIGASLEGGRVTVAAAATTGGLRITVDDDGPSPASTTDADGLGLSTTRERLSTLYGDRARLTIGRGENERGTRVVIEIQRQQ